MSPAKKPPRPVTRWFTIWEDHSIGNMAWRKKQHVDQVRCRVTPLRPATDAEIERLAKAMWRSMPKGPWWCPWERTSLSTRGTVRCLAIAAWKRGAR